MLIFMSLTSFVVLGALDGPSRLPAPSCNRAYAIVATSPLRSVEVRRPPERSWHWNLEDISHRFTQEMPDGAGAEVPSPNQVFMANIAFTLLDRLTLTQPAPPRPSLVALPGPKSHESFKDYLDLGRDRRTIVVGMNQIVLLTRPSPNSPHAADAPDTLMTTGFHGCAGLMLEGENFVLVSHLYSIHVTPPSELVPYLLREIEQVGLSTKEMKARVIGGSDRSPEVAFALIEEMKKREIPLIETDILGDPDKATHERRSFGYRLGPTGPTEAFRIRVGRPSIQNGSVRLN